MLALVATRSAGPVDRATALELSCQVPREHWKHRIDVLSVEEAVCLVGYHPGELKEDPSR